MHDITPHDITPHGTAHITPDDTSLRTARPVAAAPMTPAHHSTFPPSRARHGGGARPRPVSPPCTALHCAKAALRPALRQRCAPRVAAGIYT